jgi:ketosteroid isomerase-like protein
MHAEARKGRAAMTSPARAVELLNEAFNDGDIEAALSFYEESAVIVVTETGRMARGTAELRGFFEEVMKASPSTTQFKTHVIETDGIALFLSRWTLTRHEQNGVVSSRHLTATSVSRKQPSGDWKLLIDNSHGPLLLGPD